MDSNETGVTRRDKWVLANDVMVTGFFATAIVAAIAAVASPAVPTFGTTTVGPFVLEPFVLSYGAIMAARVTNLLRPAPNRLALPFCGGKDGN